MKKKIIKWNEILACEEMIGKPVRYMPTGGSGKIVGKVIDVEPGTVTAEIYDEKIFKKIHNPVHTSMGCVMGVRIDHDSSKTRNSKAD